MFRLAIAGLACLWCTALAPQARLAQSVPRCLHEVDEAPSDLQRRAAAIELAKAINSSEARIFNLTRQYVPLSQLVTLPPAPEGFKLRHHTDGQSYLFSLKDQKDACRFGIFSDQDGIVYEKTPMPAQIASGS